jgi:hypothetical protein
MTDGVLVTNVLKWLSKNPDIAAVKIVTSESGLVSALPGSVTLMEEASFESQLASADVFMGRVRDLSAAQIDALIAFVKGGGGLFTGDSATSDLSPDKRATYAFPIDDQLGYIAWNKGINRLLRDAGLGIAYGLIDSKKSHQKFNTNIPVQWWRDYPDAFSAIDDLSAVAGDGDNNAVSFRKSASYVPEGALEEKAGRKTRQIGAQDAVVAVATLIGQQMYAMTEVLPEGDPLRTELDAKLEYLNPVEKDAEGRRVLKGPIQKALCMHEAVSLFRLAPEETRKSKIVDSLLGYPTTAATPRVSNEEIVLTEGRESTQLTEFYAPPGEVVTLDFSDSPSVIGKGYQVHLNVENAYNFHSELNFRRPPLMQRAFPIDQPVVKVASPIGGVVLIRYKSAEAIELLTGAGDQYDLQAAAMLDDSPDGPKLTARITGAVRYPCFVSGKHDNADFAEQLKSAPGYKVAAICKNVWVDIPRFHVDEVGLGDIEVWATQFDSSYAKSFEVGPSIKTRTTRITDITIPGQEPGMPTRMGRMSSLSKEDSNLADVSTGAGMTAHKVGHGVFGANYSWARSLGTHREFRANQMTRYENFKNGSVAGANRGLKATSPFDAYGQIQVIAKLLSQPGVSYFSTGEEIDYTASHTGGDLGGGGAHMLFLYGKWLYDFDGKQGVNVWGQMCKDFADDIKRLEDGSPESQPRFPLRRGDAHVHSEDHAVRWAGICGYNIIPYLEVWGFKVSDETKAHPLIQQAKPWLPMASRYFNESVKVHKDATAAFDFNRIDGEGMTVALSSEGGAIKPEFLSITKKPDFGKLVETSGGVHTYTPAPGAQGRDSFAYRVRHPETKQEQVFRVYVDVLGAADAVSPDEALKAFGHGALVEVFESDVAGSTAAAGAGEGSKGKTRKGGASDGPSMLDRLASLDASLLPSESSISLQGFESNAGQGGAARLRAYLEVPEDGEYTFWVLSSSTTVLRMNTEGEDPRGASVLIENAGGSKSEFTHQSEPIELKAGARYYVEFSRGSSSKGAMMRLGWTRDAKATEPDEVIPNRYLIPVGKPVSIVPVDDVVQAAEGQSVIIDSLANDKDYRFNDASNTECLHIHYVGQTANGRTELVNDNQQIKYTPNPGFKGVDKFQYAIQSKTFRDRIRVGSVTIHVK